MPGKLTQDEGKGTLTISQGRHIIAKSLTSKPWTVENVLEQLDWPDYGDKGDNEEGHAEENGKEQADAN